MILFSLFFFFGHSMRFSGILVPIPGIELSPLVVGEGSPNHRTVRKFPQYSLLRYGETKGQRSYGKSLVQGHITVAELVLLF